MASRNVKTKPALDDTAPTKPSSGDSTIASAPTATVLGNSIAASTFAMVEINQKPFHFGTGSINAIGGISMFPSRGETFGTGNPFFSPSQVHYFILQLRLSS